MPVPVFMTGFPGFIATSLIKKLHENYSEFEFLCLVQPKFKEMALNHQFEIETSVPGLKGRIKLLPGDITETDCALSPADFLLVTETVQDVWHLAAIYDLAIPRDPAYKVNVVGTRNVLNLISKIKTFRQHFYISTAYVSGNRMGTIYEEELDAGQSFRNYYEETKYLAEIEVRRTVRQYKTTIFRPAITVGNSETGLTQKFDGPYYPLRTIDKLPKYFAMVQVGSGKNTINLVPVDFLVSAMAYLATKVQGEGKIYHLTDPNPLTQKEILNLFIEKLGKKFILLPLPEFMVNAAMKIPYLSEVLGLPRQTIAYFDHPHRYDCSNTLADLKGSGIAVPRFKDYAIKLIDFYHLKKDEFLKKQAMF